MWLPDLSGFSSTPSPVGLSLFIAQAWHELLSTSTPDSFRARTLDLPLLLDDLLHIAEVADSDNRWVQYLPMLASEINDALLSEQRMVGATSQLQTAVAAVIKSAKDKRVEETRRKILVAKGIFGDPCERLKQDLRTLIADQPAKKDAILRRLSTIASHVEYRGLGEEALRSLDASIVFLPPEQLAENLLRPLSAAQRRITCALSIRGPIRDARDITKGAAFADARKSRALPNDPIASKWLKAHKGKHVVSIETEARSRRSAAESQLEALSEILNVHNLYMNSASFRVSPSVLVFEPSQRCTVVQVTPSSHFGLSPRNDASGLTKDRLTKVDGRIHGRLANALQSHALALAAQDPRTAIINLWTALEAISGAEDGKSIGQRVASVISPLVAWRRIDKIVTYLALSFHEVLVAEKHGVSTKVMTNSKNFRVSQDDVLSAITGPKDNQKITYLLKGCDSCPLLRQRLYLAWKSFSDPGEINADLQASKQRVEWQIQRLYRARNLLVHRGEQSHLIWRLLQNAQYYVSISLSRVLHDMSEMKDWDIDSSLDYQALRFEHVCEDLRERSGRNLMHVDLLGARSKTPNVKIWP